jgi:hypothetical protein
MHDCSMFFWSCVSSIGSTSMGVECAGSGNGNHVTSLPARIMVTSLRTRRTRQCKQTILHMQTKHEITSLDSHHGHETLLTEFSSFRLLHKIRLTTLVCMDASDHRALWKEHVHKTQLRRNSTRGSFSTTTQHVSAAIDGARFNTRPDSEWTWQTC